MRVTYYSAVADTKRGTTVNKKVPPESLPEERRGPVEGEPGHEGGRDLRARPGEGGQPRVVRPRLRVRRAVEQEQRRAQAHPGAPQGNLKVHSVCPG